MYNCDLLSRAPRTRNSPPKLTTHPPPTHNPQQAFIVVSDPVVARHLLRDNALNYDKGVLAEILEPIMGKGLIPADLETWKVRRRQIVPGFHKAYIDASVAMFGRCTARAAAKLGAAADAGTAVDMEAEFLSLGLDIIGLGVFNYDFGSVTAESPVIRSVYGVLKEAEHRSTFYIPYWNLPLAEVLGVNRSRVFASVLLKNWTSQAFNPV